MPPAPEKSRATKPELVSRLAVQQRVALQRFAEAITLSRTLPVASLEKTTVISGHSHFVNGVRTESPLGERLFEIAVHAAVPGGL